MCLLRPKPTFRHRNPSRLLLSTSFDNGARRFGHSCRKLPLHVVECDHTHGLCVHLSALRAKKRIAAAPSPVLVVVHITAAHVLRVRHRTACSVQSMRTSSEAGPHTVGHLLLSRNSRLSSATAVPARTRCTILPWGTEGPETRRGVSAARSRARRATGHGRSKMHCKGCTWPCMGK